jgi:predicted transcriptional regulator
LHFHDLRRELASTLRESGAPDHIVADVLGHANISTTSRYLKASRAGLKQYMQRLEEHREHVAAQKKADEKKAARKQRNAKRAAIRTSFAHAAENGGSGRATKTAAKLLN